MAERVGIFGGTFDPVHTGHLIAALVAHDGLHLDRTLLVVAGDPWQKEGRVVASAADRFDMVSAAVEGVEGLEASRIELDRDGPTYTMETFETLSSPDRELFVIVGADVARRLDGWHRADELRAAATVAVVGRKGEEATVPASGWRHVVVSMPRVDISSTDLRGRIARGEPVDFFVPPAAVRVIRDRRLYTPA